MSGDRTVSAWPKLPRLSSTLPRPTSRGVCIHGEYWRASRLTADAFCIAALAPKRSYAVSFAVLHNDPHGVVG